MRRRKVFWTRAAVSCASMLRHCSKAPRSSMTSAIAAIGKARAASGRPAMSWPMSQPSKARRATPKTTAMRPMATAQRMRSRTPAVNCHNRGSKCMGVPPVASQDRPNADVPQSTITKNECTFSYRQKSAWPVPMTPDWDDLRVFLALAREGSLTAAARRLEVSHPTIARRVQALESTIGARLFDRLPDRFALTAAGEELLADAEAMAQAADSIHRRSAGLGADTARGTVRLSAGEAMTGYLAGHLPRLRRDLQCIEFELTASHMLANLSRREADLLIRDQCPISPASSPASSA